MKLYKALAGVDNLKFDSIRRNRWPAGIDMIIDFNTQKFKKATVVGGPYSVYRLTQEDYFATDWRGLSSVTPPDVSVMNFEQLLRESDNRVVSMSIVGDRKKIILPLTLGDKRAEFKFTVAGNVLTRV